MRAKQTIGLSAGLTIPLALVLSACSPQPQTDTKSKTGIVAGGLPRRNDWERMRECAAQADRLAARAGWIEGKRDGDITLMGWQNHYSPKYERCYVLVSYLSNPVVGKGHTKQVGFFFSELIDAFEGKVLASDSSGNSESAQAQCNIDGNLKLFENCDACRQFIDDRMNN